METKYFSTLQEHLEYAFGVNARKRSCFTDAGRTKSREEKEDFVFSNVPVIEYGIKGQIKQHYLSRGYEFDKEEQDSGNLRFHKQGDLVSVIITPSDTLIRVGVVEIPKL